MAPILTQSDNYISIQQFLDDECVDPLDNEEAPGKVSMWIQEKDIVQASVNVSKLTKLTPGIYSVYVSRDRGIYCKSVKAVSDELFIFPDSISQKLLQEIDSFWNKADLYKKNNLLHKRGILLEGLPGTGKSSIITLLSQDVINKGGVVFKVTGPNNLIDYISFMLYQFKEVEPETPIITVIEDLDQYGEVGDRLLDFLDGKTNIEHHVVLATSNNTEEIPDTFLRPSRIDLKIEIALPGEITRREYFIKKGVPEEDVAELTMLSNNLSFADLKEIYICIYLLGYSKTDAIQKVKSPRTKKNYLSQFPASGSVGI